MILINLIYVNRDKFVLLNGLKFRGTPICDNGDDNDKKAQKLTSIKVHECLTHSVSDHFQRMIQED